MLKDKSKKFEFILLEATDEALSTLGESVKKAIYFHLETTYKMKRTQIPQDIDGFSETLEKMFGLGARHIEILIMKQLYPKIQITCNWQGPEFILPNLSFKEYIELMRKEYSKTKIKGTMEFFIDATDQQCTSEQRKRIPNNL